MTKRSHLQFLGYTPILHSNTAVTGEAFGRCWLDPGREPPQGQRRRHLPGPLSPGPRVVMNTVGMIQLYFCVGEFGSEI